MKFDKLTEAYLKLVNEDDNFPGNAAAAAVTEALSILAKAYHGTSGEQHEQITEIYSIVKLWQNVNFYTNTGSAESRGILKIFYESIFGPAKAAPAANVTKQQADMAQYQQQQIDKKQS